jgi:uncharacterized protein YajQ (UPF0234 family)
MMEEKEKKKKFIKNVINSRCLSDREKIMLLKLNTGAELRRLEHIYKKKMIKRNIDVHAVEEWAKALTKQEEECPVVKEYLNKRIKDYEAYDTMHSDDGIVGVSVSARRL